jgi:hypothetical protein
VAQLGSAPALGAGGREFKSPRPDKKRPGQRVFSGRLRLTDGLKRSVDSQAHTPWWASADIHGRRSLSFLALWTVTDRRGRDSSTLRAGCLGSDSPQLRGNASHFLEFGCAEPPGTRLTGLGRYLKHRGRISRIPRFGLDHCCGWFHSRRGVTPAASCGTRALIILLHRVLFQGTTGVAQGSATNRTPGSNCECLGVLKLLW